MRGAWVEGEKVISKLVTQRAVRKTRDEYFDEGYLSFRRLEIVRAS